MNEAIETAVILAAGMGRRLQAIGCGIPKALIRLGTRSILEESIQRLASGGMRRIVLVTGYRSEQFQPLSARYSGLVQCVHNGCYADSGSMYSLYCVRELVDEPFLLLESDLVYERRALEECLGARHPNVVLLSGLTNATDAVFVQACRGQLVSMSKDRRALSGSIAGELVGICKISSELFRVMLATAEDRFLTTRHMDYETDCLVSAAKTVPISCHVVPDLCWCEIDDAGHLERAKRLIYPEVSRRDSLLVA